MYPKSKEADNIYKKHFLPENEIVSQYDRPVLSWIILMFNNTNEEYTLPFLVCVNQICAQFNMNR
jgi:hypothetical protein